MCITQTSSPEAADLVGTGPTSSNTSVDLLFPAGLFLAVLADGLIAIHHSHFQMTGGHHLFFKDVVPGGEHLADLHEGFVLGFRNDEDGVEGHSQADGAEDQVAVRTCSYLWWEDIK